MSAGIDIPVGVKHAAFKRGLDEMRAEARKFKTDFSTELSSGIGNIATGAFLAGAAISAVVGGVSALLDKAGRIQDLSDRFGETAETVQRVGSAAQQSGSEIELIAKVLTSLTLDANKAAMGVDANAKAFEEMGIQAAVFRDLGMDQKLIVLADAYQRSSEDGQQAAQFVELIGKKYADLIPLLADGGAALREAFADAPVIASPAIRAMDAIGDGWTRAKEKSAVWAVQTIAHMQSVNNKVMWIGDLVRNKFDLTAAILDNQKRQSQIDAFGGWGEEETKPRKKGKLENAEKESDRKARVAEEETLGKLREDFNEAAKKDARDALDDEEKLQALYSARNDLLKLANTTTVEGLKAKKEALALDREAQTLSNKIFTDAEERGKKTAANREAHADKLKGALEEEHSGEKKRKFDALKTPAEKIASLKEDQKKVVAEANKAQRDAYMLYGGDDATNAKRVELRTLASQKRKQAGDIQSQIDGLAPEKKEASRPTVQASSLREVGGGGRAYVSGVDGLRDTGKEQLAYLKIIAEAISGNKLDKHVPTNFLAGTQSQSLRGLRTSRL